MEPWRRKLIYRRERCGLTVAALATALGLHESCVEGLERGSLHPSGDMRETWENAIEDAERRRSKKRE